MATYPTTGSSPWGSNLKTYIDAGDAQVGTTLGLSNGTDDTTTINTILAAGGAVRGVPGQSYLISAPLVVWSGTTLDMTGCTITLKAGSNCNVLNNASMTPQRTVADGAITTGTNTLTSATASFSSADTGRTVIVQGAAAGGYVLTALMTFVSSTSVTLTKFDGSACNAGTTVAAASTSIYTRDKNIRITGGTWDRAVNAGSGVNLHAIRLRHIDGLTMKGMYHKSTSGGKYALAIADCTAFLLDDMDFLVSSDGVHIDGPADEGIISNMRGTSGDDFVALTGTDWPSTSGDSAGDITDVLITDANGKSSLSVVKIMGGPAGGCRRITATGLRGTASSAAACGIWIGDDNGNPATVGGLLDGIRILDTAITTASNKPQILINGTNLQRVEIDGLFHDDANLTTAVITIAPLAATTMDRVSIRNVTVANLGATTSTSVVSTNSNSGIRVLELNGIHVGNVASLANQPVVALLGTGAIGTLTARGITIAASTGGYMFQVQGTITRATLADSTHISTGSNSSHAILLSSASATITDLDVHDVHANYGSTGGNFIYLAGATTVVTRATLSGIHMIGGGTLVISPNSGATFNNLIVQNSTISGSANVIDLAGTTDLDTIGVVATPTGSTVSVRATAVVRWRGYGGKIVGTPSVTAGGKLAIVGHEFIGTATAGGLPTVAAGVGAGTGATVAITGTDRTGTVTVTIGTGPAAGAQTTLTFIGTWAAMKSVTLTPTNAAAASANLYVSAQSTTAFTVSSANTPSGSMTFNYLVTG